MNHLIPYIRAFINQPAINKSKFCQQAGVSQQHLNDVLSGKYDLSPGFLRKLAPLLIHYGLANLPVPVDHFREILYADKKL